MCSNVWESLNDFFYYLKLQIHYNPYTTTSVTGYLNRFFFFPASPVLKTIKSTVSDFVCIYFNLTLQQSFKDRLLFLSSLFLFRHRSPLPHSSYPYSLALRSAAWSLNTGAIKLVSNCTFEIQQSVSPCPRNATMTPDKAKHPLSKSLFTIPAYAWMAAEEIKRRKERSEEIFFSPPLFLGWFLWSQQR